MCSAQPSGRGQACRTTLQTPGRNGGRYRSPMARPDDGGAGDVAVSPDNFRLVERETRPLEDQCAEDRKVGKANRRKTASVGSRVVFTRRRREKVAERSRGFFPHHP